MAHKFFLVVDVDYLQHETSFYRLFLLRYLNSFPSTVVVRPCEVPYTEIFENDIVFLYFIRPHQHEMSSSIIRTIPLLQKKTSKICFYMEDMYHQKQILNLCREYNVKHLILNMNHYFYSSLYQKQGLHVHCLPYGLDKSDIRLVSETKKRYDVIIYGNMNPKVYPFRFRVWKLLQKHDKEFKILYIPFCSKNEKSIDTKKKELYDQIESCYLGLVCPSIYNFLLKKHLEIPWCGTMLLGQIPVDYQHVFQKHLVVSIHRKMSDDEILSVLRGQLKDKAKLLERTRKLQVTVKENFSMEIVKKEFENLKKKMYSIENR